MESPSSKHPDLPLLSAEQARLVEFLHERHAAAPHRAVTFRDMADYLKCRPGNVHNIATRLRIAGWLDTGRRLALTPAARAMLAAAGEMAVLAESVPPPAAGAPA